MFACTPHHLQIYRSDLSAMQLHRRDGLCQGGRRRLQRLVLRVLFVLGTSRDGLLRVVLRT